MYTISRVFVLMLCCAWCSEVTHAATSLLRKVRASAGRKTMKKNIKGSGLAPFAGSRGMSFVVVTPASLSSLSGRSAWQGTGARGWWSWLPLFRDMPTMTSAAVAKVADDPKTSAFKEAPKDGKETLRWLFLLRKSKKIVIENNGLPQSVPTRLWQSFDAQPILNIYKQFGNRSFTATELRNKNITEEQARLFFNMMYYSVILQDLIGIKMPLSSAKNADAIFFIPRVIKSSKDAVKTVLGESSVKYERYFETRIIPRAVDIMLKIAMVQVAGGTIKMDLGELKNYDIPLLSELNSAEALIDFAKLLVSEDVLATGRLIGINMSRGLTLESTGGAYTRDKTKAVLAVLVNVAAQVSIYSQAMKGGAVHDKKRRQGLFYVAKAMNSLVDEALESIKDM
jgi:hypothetical protein